MTTIGIRRVVPVVVAAALAAPALAACSSSSSGGTGSTSSTSSAATTSPTSAPATASALPTPGTSGLATPSVNASQLTAIVTCLRNAGLPTPTSTSTADVGAEVLQLLRDPRTAAALRGCGVPLPGIASPTSS